MICINCILQQISLNLFKIHATTTQTRTYRSSMIIVDISSLCFNKNLLIPFKLKLSTFSFVFNSFDTYTCQIFKIPMEVGLKWCTTICSKYWSHQGSKKKPKRFLEWLCNLPQQLSL